MEIKFKGKTDDLLFVSEDGVIKSTRLLDVDENTDPDKDQILDVCITSSAPLGNHEIFDKLIGKNITVTICVE